MRRPVSLALLAIALAAGLSSGCVTRRVMITSNPPGAIVYRDGQPLGPTPVEQPFVYYGKYRYRLVADGYAPLDVEPELATPWYQYPGIDFVFENILPINVRDTQVLHFDLAPLEAMRNTDVLGAAEALRGRGKSIGSPDPTVRRSRNKAAPVANTNAPPLAPATTNNASPTENPLLPNPDEVEPDEEVKTDEPKQLPVPKKEPAGTAGFQTAPVGRRQPPVSPTPGGGSR